MITYEDHIPGPCCASHVRACRVDGRGACGARQGRDDSDYPGDTPYPSRLVLGWRGGRPLHVVAAYNATDDETIVVTVYEPLTADWELDFRRKKR